MKAWKDMTRIEQMRAEYSDLHKDVFGMRPTHEAFIEVDKMSDEDYIAEYNRLVSLLTEDN